MGSASTARTASGRSIALRVMVALSVAVTIFMNYLASALPLFGRGTGEVSAEFPSLVTPAGYVFSIWGLIYLGLIGYSVAQFVRPLAASPLPDRLAWPLIASSIANVSWLFLWHSLNIYWSVPVMLALLASLIVAYLIARREDPGAPSTLERWAVRAPLGLYLGWISVATIANISSALEAAGWDRWGFRAEAWGVIVLIVGAALALTALARERDTVFAGVFVWAFAGIAVETPAEPVRTAATVLAAVVAAGILASAVVRRRLI